MADQVSAAQKLLEEPEKYFDGPSLRIDQRDDLCWNVQQVCGDSQDAITFSAGRAEF